jgi:hypothetical protein
MFLNALGYSGAIVHIPSVVGKLITQGSLPVALVVALSINRRLVIRPNVFLALVTLLPIAAILPALNPQFLGTVYRTFRLAEFVAVLWLLTPWFGRRDILLVRCHLRFLAVILVTVVVGLFLSPGQALYGGRLTDAIWDIPATQVAHYAAVTIGLVVVLWLCGQFRGRNTLLVVAGAGFILIFTHTRTALVAMMAGIVLAGLSLIVTKSRARRLLAISGVVFGLGVLTLSSFITTWLARGEGTKELTNLTGRTAVWTPLLNFPRNGFEEIFGFGLSNGSFNGMAIDSNWFSSYQEQGLFGVGICVAILVFLLVSAYFRPPGMHRALALFLITYCLVTSFVEDTFADATPYLLEMTLAASLLAAPLIRARGRPQEPLKIDPDPADPESWGMVGPVEAGSLAD